MEREGAFEEGGLEATIKSFAITISYVAFIFKVSNLATLTPFLPVFRLLCAVEGVVQLFAGHKRDKGSPSHHKDPKDHRDVLSSAGGLQPWGGPIFGCCRRREFVQGQVSGECLWTVTTYVNLYFFPSLLLLL
jgi:hypothetical protein